MKTYYIIFRLPGKSIKVQGFEVQGSSLADAIRQACAEAFLTELSIMSIMVL